MKFLFALLFFISCNKEKVESIFTNYGQKLVVVKDEPQLPDPFIKKVSFDILLTGEVHGIAENYTVRKSIIKQLHREKGVTVLVIEFPVSSSKLIQNYLNTGDETDLKFIYSNLKSTSEYTQEGIDFFRWLREYNSTLETDKKLKLIGVDIEHQPTVTKYYISRILKDKSIPIEIEKNIQRLLKENLSTELLMTIQNDVMANDLQYRLLLQTDYKDFNILIKNALVRFQYGSNSQLFDEAREKAMIDTYISLVHGLGAGPVYGHFGDAHLSSYSISRERLALLLKKNEVTKSLLQVSIPFIYTNSAYRNSQGAQVSLDVITHKKWHQQVEDKYYFYDFSMLSAKDAKSLGWPFSNVLFGPEPGSGVLTDYFKYFLLINTARACTTYQQ